MHPLLRKLMSQNGSAGAAKALGMSNTMSVSSAMRDARSSPSAFSESKPPPDLRDRQSPGPTTPVSATGQPQMPSAASQGPPQGSGQPATFGPQSATATALNSMPYGSTPPGASFFASMMQGPTRSYGQPLTQRGGSQRYDAVDRSSFQRSNFQSGSSSPRRTSFGFQQSKRGYRTDTGNPTRFGGLRFF